MRQEYHRRWRQELLQLIDPETGRLAENFSFYRPCPLCGQDKANLLFIKDGFSFVKCKYCYFVYVNPIVDDKKVGNVHKDYACNYYEQQYQPSTQLIEEYNNILKEIIKYKANGHLLDVGCGTGEFLYHAKQLHFQVTGIEINEIAADKARGFFGFKVLAEKFEDIDFPSECFNIVTFLQVLEHLYNPLAALREAHRIIKPSGVVAIGVPNIDSFIIKVLQQRHRHFAGKEHINYFTPHTLSAMVKRAGFRKILKLRTHGEECIPSTIVALMLNPAKYDFFAPTYFARGGHTGTAGKLIDKQVKKTAIYRLVVKAITKADYLPRCATNLLKQGAYIELYAMK